MDDIAEALHANVLYRMDHCEGKDVANKLWV